MHITTSEVWTLISSSVSTIAHFPRQSFHHLYEVFYIAMKLTRRVVALVTPGDYPL